MQFKAAIFATLATGAVSQILSLDASESSSVLSVLRTALPTSLIYEALTNPAAVSSQVASEFSAGQTPSWYSALPSDIQTILQPSLSAIITTGTSTPTGLPNVTAITGNSTILPTGGFGNHTVGSNSTTLRTHSMGSSTATTTTSRGGSGSGSGSGSSETSGAGFQGGSSTPTGNGATMPTAIFGIGLAGAAGLVGVLAL